VEYVDWENHRLLMEVKINTFYGKGRYSLQMLHVLLIVALFDNASQAASFISVKQ
jgi:hypothetical protein